MRPPRKETFVDASEAQQAQGESGSLARHSRKVSFNTPASSLCKGRMGHPKLEEAGSSQDSFFSPPARSRPIPKTTKPKYTRHLKAELEARNWNSSTATFQDKEEPRLRSTKNRHSKGSIYHLTTDPRRDSFQAVRVSGPDRVVIAPVSPQAQDALDIETRRSAVPAPGLRRPGPSPAAPHVSVSRRISQDVSRSKARPTEVQRSRSHRERRSKTMDADVLAGKEASRSRSKSDKVISRNSMSTRPVPEPVRPQRTVPNGSNALYHGSGSSEMFHERHSNSPGKAQWA